MNDTSIYQLTLGHHLLGDEFNVMSNVFQPFFRYYSLTLTLHVFLPHELVHLFAIVLIMVV